MNKLNLRTLRRFYRHLNREEIDQLLDIVELDKRIEQQCKLNEQSGSFLDTESELKLVSLKLRHKELLADVEIINGS